MHGGQWAKAAIGAITFPRRIMMPFERTLGEWHGLRPPRHRREILNRPRPTSLKIQYISTIGARAHLAGG
eukprot:7023895-Alexandrium_andersonii.AAC.1